MLDRNSREILSVLDERGGLLTGRVAARISTRSSNPRANSQFVRDELVRLRQRGLVDYLDDQKPVCWRRTEAGTLALNTGR